MDLPCRCRRVVPSPLPSVDGGLIFLHEASSPPGRELRRNVNTPHDGSNQRDCASLESRFLRGAGGTDTLVAADWGFFWGGTVSTWCLVLADVNLSEILASAGEVGAEIGY